MTACERSGAVLDDAHIFASGGMSLWVDMVERRGPSTPLIPAGSLGCSIDFFQCVTERNHGASVATGNMKGKFPSKRPQASGLIATDGGGLWGEKRHCGRSAAVSSQLKPVSRSEWLKSMRFAKCWSPQRHGIHLGIDLVASAL